MPLQPQSLDQSRKNRRLLPLARVMASVRLKSDCKTFVEAECDVKRYRIFRQWNAPAHPAPGEFLSSCWYALGVSGAACRLGVVRCSVVRPGSVNVGVFGQS